MVKHCFVLGLVWGQLVLTSVSLMWVIKDDIFWMPIKFVRPQIILHEGLFDSFSTSDYVICQYDKVWQWSFSYENNSSSFLFYPQHYFFSCSLWPSALLQLDKLWKYTPDFYHFCNKCIKNSFHVSGSGKAPIRKLMAMFQCALGRWCGCIQEKQIPVPA